MNFNYKEFDLYLDKMKKMDISKVFTEDISFPEYVNLKYIDHLSKKSDNAAVQVSQLVDSLAVTPQAVSKLLRNLEDKGCIERYTNKSDRRITEVKLTKKGAAVYAVTNSQAESVFSAVFSGFTSDEFKIFRELTEKFLSLYADAIDKMKWEVNA